MGAQGKAKATAQVQEAPPVVRINSEESFTIDGSLAHKRTDPELYPDAKISKEHKPKARRVFPLFRPGDFDSDESFIAAIKRILQNFTTLNQDGAKLEVVFPPVLDAEGKVVKEETVRVIEPSAKNGLNNPGGCTWKELKTGAKKRMKFDYAWFANVFSDKLTNIHSLLLNQWLAEKYGNEQKSEISEESEGAQVSPEDLDGI